uniref:Uncharacterized protein n=1 Tax=Panagrolaimus sp. JU765 TaxID=591449 RepID=A0AC34Q6L2_9BILA
MNYQNNGQANQPTFYTDPMQAPVLNIPQQPQQVVAPMQPMPVHDPHLGVHNTIDEPFVLSPNAQLPFTPSDFADYLSGVDQGIDNCRDLIGDHWNAFDFDTLMDGTGESPENHTGGQHLSLDQTHPVYNYSPTMPGHGSNKSSPGTRPSPQQTQMPQIPKMSTVQPQPAQIQHPQTVPMMQQSRINPNMNTNFQQTQQQQQQARRRR